MGGQNCATDSTEHLFTGKERDNESGNDYFPARYYGSSMGRFLSPDPSGLSLADPDDPQSLNLYSYVGNHPFQYVDPYGLNWFNQAPCSGTYYAQTSILTGIKSFFAHLFANCGGSSSGGASFPDDPGGPSGGGGSPKPLSKDELSNRFKLITLNFKNTACGDKFADVGKRMGHPFSPESFVTNLQSNLTQAPGQTIAGSGATFAMTNPKTWKITTLKPFYGLSPKDQAGTLQHEGTHSYFRLGDNNGNAFLNFKNEFDSEGYHGGDSNGTHDFTNWLEGGCPSQ